MSKVTIELCENNLANSQGMNEIVRQLDQESAGMAEFVMRQCIGQCGDCVTGTPVARINGAKVTCDTSEEMAIKIRNHIVAAQKNPRPSGKE